MAWFSRKKPVETVARHYPSNPHKNNSRSFFSGNVDRLLHGWDTQSSSIDYYLRSELAPLRARSRELVRKNPYGKRFLTSIKSNIVGPNGVAVQAQSKRFVNNRLELDTLANEAIEAAFADWSSKYCDYTGKSNFIDLQNIAVTSAAQDGEFIFEIFEGNQYGKYGFQVKNIDPELLDTTVNHETAEGGEVRLGVEYNKNGKPTWYHFRQRNNTGQYRVGQTYKVNARNIIHGFVNEWPDQSRGIPWMHASLEKTKHLEKYDEAAMIAARYGASKMVFMSSEAGDEYTGDEDGEGSYEGQTLDNVEAGSIQDIGSREVHQFDPKYPHEMYDQFVKSTLRGICSGIGVSYHSISNDLEGVNYSSIRTGVLEDREIFKGIQNWFIFSMIQPIYERWLSNAILRAKISIGRRPLARPIEEYLAAHYQPRRWAWVDPQKDGQSNDLAIRNRTKSRSQVIREQGGDPDTLWNEIERENELLKTKGLLAEVQEATEVIEDAEQD